MKTSREVCQETLTTGLQEKCRPKPTKVAFLDLDGTFYSGKEYDDVKRAFQEELVRKIYGLRQKKGEELPPLPEFMKETIAKYNEKAAEVGFPRACSEVGGNATITIKVNETFDFTCNINPNPKIRTMVKQLRMSGFAIALVTGNLAKQTGEILKKILGDDSLSFFDVIITRDMKGVGQKPWSSPFMKALETLQQRFPGLINPEEIWAIGDTYCTDIKPVKTAVKRLGISNSHFNGVLIGLPDLEEGPKKHVLAEDLDRVCVLRELSRLGRLMVALEERKFRLTTTLTPQRTCFFS